MVFLSGSGSVQDFYLCLYNVYVLPLGDSLIKKGGVEITLTILTLSHFCACHKPGPGFPMSCRGLFCVQQVKVGGDCSLVELLTISV